MPDITKFCADNLRAFAAKNDIKLKTTHAHELTAAFFGYKSRAALLTDLQHPVCNLTQANTIIMAPIALIEDRRKNLQNLPINLPDNETLFEWFYTPLLEQKWISSVPQSAYDDRLALSLADEYLRQNQIEKIYHRPVGESVKKTEYTSNGMVFIVTRFYQILTQKILIPGTIQNVTILTNIRLQRIAGHIGFRSEISVQIDRSKQLI